MGPSTLSHRIADDPPAVHGHEMWRIDGQATPPRALDRPRANTPQEVSTMFGSVSAYSYGSGGSGGGAYWLLVILIAAVVIAAGTWLFMRIRNRRAHQSPGPPPSA
jgi:uncharacterized protein HemX